MPNMTWEDVFNRVETIMNSLPSPDTPEYLPACERLAEEANMEHEDVHKMINSIASAGAVRGYLMSPDFVLLGFDLGRRWGLIEAGEALSGGTLDLPTTEDSNGES